MLYYQCKLSQNNALTVAWIPEKGAKVGFNIELPEVGGFWRVIEVHTPPMTEEQLQITQKLNRNSLPSIN